MEISRNAPATAEGELRIDADPQTVFTVISAIDQWPSWNPDVKSVSVEGLSSRAWCSGEGRASSLTSVLQVVDPPPRDRLDRHHHGHQGRARVPVPSQRRRHHGAFGEVLEG